MRRYTLVISVLFLLASCLGPFPALSQTAEVKGVLIDATDKQPVEGAIVHLWKITGVIAGYEISSEKTPTVETRTDSTGSFFFIDVPPGRYKIGGTRQVESADFSLHPMNYNGDRSGTNPAIDVAGGQRIDLGVIANCRFTVCGP